MTLRPVETTQKALLSTPSRFIGEYEAEGILLTHAWPGFHDRSASIRWQEGPASRSAYILAFSTEPSEKGPGKPLPDYSPTGDIVAAYLSVLFGKRFDHHGLVEGSGFYHIPELSQFGMLVNPSLPHNSHNVRPDFDIQLNLSEIRRLAPLLSGESLTTGFVHTFQGSAKFYSQALQNYEKDPEVAYLHLISAGEIISNFHEFDKQSFLDTVTKEYLQAIRAQMPNGDKIARHIEGRLMLIKRRFVETIMGLVDERFFEKTEAYEGFGRFKSADFRQAISAAYDLRSKYVHTGVPFGRWVSFHQGVRNSEIQIGAPVVNDAEFGKVLARAPTLVGLERVIRYCLINFAARNGAYIERRDFEVDA